MASREPLIEPYRPPEPDPTYEFDVEYDDYAEDAPAGAPRVLWGRIAIFAGALLLAFLLGRASAPEGVPAADLRQARAEARDARVEAEALRGEIAVLQTEAEALDEEKTNAAEDEAAASEQPSEPENETYVVQAGDTLTTIAEDFYGDASLDDLIAAANPDVDPYALRVGQELIIPPKPE